VVEIADFGAFVRIGPVDALLHVSQLMDDFISYDEKQGVLTRQRKQTQTRHRRSSPCENYSRLTWPAGSSGKIGVTARQPFLGKLDWLKEEVAQVKEATEKRATAVEEKETKIAKKGKA